MSDLTTAAKEARALEAERILNDDTINAALDAMRSDAVEALIKAKADDAVAISRLQADVGAVDQFRSALHAFITQGRPQKPRTGLA